MTDAAIICFVVATSLLAWGLVMSLICIVVARSTASVMQDSHNQRNSVNVSVTCHPTTEPDFDLDEPPPNCEHDMVTVHDDPSGGDEWYECDECGQVIECPWGKE